MDAKQVTVAGKIFTMPAPYEEGHTLTAGEASQLNQVFHENIRNNFAKKVKEADEAGKFDAADFQSQIDKYANEYEMGGRRATGPRAPADPVAKEALRLARSAIEAQLRSQGKKPSDFSNIGDIASKLVTSNPVFTERARENVAAAQAAAQETLGSLLGELTEKPAEEAKPAEAA